MIYRIVSIFTLKFCIVLFLVSLVITFLMFIINFTTMAMPYNVFLNILLLPLLLSVLSYIGFVLEIVYRWDKSSRKEKNNDFYKALALAFALSLLMIFSLGMILPSLDYPR
jgi:hypothetical protein